MQMSNHQIKPLLALYFGVVIQQVRRCHNFQSLTDNVTVVLGISIEKAPLTAYFLCVFYKLAYKNNIMFTCRFPYIYR